MANFRFTLALSLITFSQSFSVFAQQKPNVILIYADDLGYGDVSCYGATKIKTPNIDKLAAGGLRFTHAHATSATCTPSRYSMLTGRYAWRKNDTGIAPGDAALLIPTDKPTMPGVLREAGYKTGVIGKWHLGLGPKGGPDWNHEIKPGPLEIGFDYSFLLPATGDRVPCVYVENHRIVDLDPADPIMVSYKEPIGEEPTGKNNPELLKMKYSHGHDMTIVNGVSRIGYMTGGKAARWIDEEMADVLTHKAVTFIEKNQKSPFFLYFATQDIHVPRMPNSRFVGKSGMGPRGDAILQLDWCVGEIVKNLERLGLTDNTMIIFSSDNGPVVDDGYEDRAVELLNGHKPGGPLRGGKYSAFEAGTNIPFIVKWPRQIKPGVSGALVSQLDLLVSLASIAGKPVADPKQFDSVNMQDVFLGKSKTGLDYVIEQAVNNTLSVVKGNWKYIEPSKGPKVMAYTNIESGYAMEPQLYDIAKDPGETKNLAETNPKIVSDLAKILESERQKQMN